MVITVVSLLFWALMILILLLNRKLFGRTGVNDIFTIMWFMCAGLANTGLLGLYTPGATVNVMAVFCGVFFNVIYIVCRRISRDVYVAPQESEIEDSIRYGILLLCNAAAWVLCLMFLPGALRILFSQGFSALRLFAYQESEWISTQQLLVFQWIVQPIFIATIAMTVLSLVLKFRHRVLLLAVSGIGILLYTLLFGGRGILIRFVSFTAFAVFWQNSGRILKILRRAYKPILICVGIVALLGFLTTLRSFSGYNVFENFYVYFVGPFVYLEKLLEVHPVGEITLWGTATFGFLVCVFPIIGKIIFGIDYAAADHVLTTNAAVYLGVGENLSMNAMPTMMYPFLSDFGYPGLAFGTGVFAFLVFWVERNFYRRKSVRAYALFLYGCHLTMFSVQNYSLFKPECLSIILFMILFTTRIRVSKGYLILS